MNTYETLKKAQDDFRYLERMQEKEFKDLLFPSALDYYVIPKWELFRESPLRFIWSCSNDKLKIMSKYIDDCKGELYEE